VVEDPNIKIEEEDRSGEEEEEITHTTALRALLYLTGVVILGFLIMFAVDKFSDFSQVRNIKTIVKQINASFSDTQPIPVQVLEGYEYDLAKYRDENIRNDKLVTDINETLRKLQSQPAYVLTGVQTKSWATAQVVKTDIDTVIVPYSQRKNYPVREVVQPVTPAENKAFELYKNHPDWSKEICLKIANREIWAGMTRVQLLSSWGQPRSIDKDFTYNRNSEQWIYGTFGPYVYLENNIVSSWQE